MLSYKEKKTSFKQHKSEQLILSSADFNIFQKLFIGSFVVYNITLTSNFISYNFKSINSIQI